ncbi:glycosyltransferase family 39 protein [Roseivirga sp. UBA838]|uniref:ArnT family glycosyltransferase n=1 Tax=Roseivirga sp. UBA838 TaxID=1947393 RepID=UPI002579B71D|nr:glycosyltransferase family 39 protein [Roseivirga sp. UBA838]|tara:strand:+ start:6775 stop:8340 length:1566 start_codon:yes stop_codon:yes gene_type:complete
MLNTTPFSPFEKGFLWFFLCLVVFAFYYQLGIYPLFLEEPRRGLIALEMMMQDNYWVPTQTGDLYFRKPPLYNWLLILSYKVFGVNEWATRFFSVSSHLLLGLITYLFSKRYLGNALAVLVAFSYLLAVDILVYFSALGEIDLFYALLTTPILFGIFHYGEKGSYLKLFLLVYGLTALAFLTKGLSALPFTGISLLVYFSWKKRFRELFFWRHWLGILLFSVLVGGYFYQYSQYEEVSGWWTTLFSESAEKATGGGFSKWINHLIAFPLDTLKNLLPATFFLPVIFRKQIIQLLKANRLVWYGVLVFLSNFAVYWLSTEGRSRYIYPLFPFACLVLIYAGELSGVRWKDKYLRAVSIVCAGLMIIAFAAIPFLPSLEAVDNRWVITGMGVFLLTVLLGITLKGRVRPYLAVLAVLCVLRIGFSFIVPQTREKTTGAAKDKALATEFALLTEGKPLYRLGDVRMSLTVVFYLERERGEVLKQKGEFSQGYFFCYTEDLPTTYQQVGELSYHGEPIHLIRYTP